MRLRRLISLLTVFGFCFSLLSITSTHAADIKPPSIVIDGKSISFDSNPLIVYGTTLVPFRNIFEELGCKVEWDPKSNKVTASIDGTEIILVINSLNALVNGENVILKVAPQLIVGHTMVPLRFISQSLGKEVNWDNSSNTVTITSLPQSSPTPTPEPLSIPIASVSPEPTLSPSPSPRKELKVTESNLYFYENRFLFIILPKTATTSEIESEKQQKILVYNGQTIKAIYRSTSNYPTLNGIVLNFELEIDAEFKKTITLTDLNEIRRRFYKIN